MEAQPRPPRRIVSRLLLLAAGVALGVGLATAHFTGRLTPLYHKLGFHFVCSPNALDARFWAS